MHHGRLRRGNYCPTSPSAANRWPCSAEGQAGSATAAPVHATLVFRTSPARPAWVSPTDRAARRRRNPCGCGGGNYCPLNPHSRTDGCIHHQDVQPSVRVEISLRRESTDARRSARRFLFLAAVFPHGRTLSHHTNDSGLARAPRSGATPRRTSRRSTSTFRSRRHTIAPLAAPIDHPAACNGYSQGREPRRTRQLIGTTPFS